MQILLDSRFLVYLLLIVFFLGALIWLFICNLTRPTGIEGSFLADDEGELNAVEAEIRAGGITNSFNIKKKGKQNFEKAKIIWYCFRKDVAIRLVCLNFYKLDMCLIGIIALFLHSKMSYTFPKLGLQTSS
ncbi:hypothetical protein VIGAN_08092000 [Vigna angularis var. angularis]|uniref:Uncharacterized protein n=1 Tax=Vigna angularis var. angularis TaxID=157739 RepID=A0A0S3SND7_PHAAN|nr:hypothetical protein VIGAN_08092000 [Vigna angularis var. angularis]